MDSDPEVFRSRRDDVGLGEGEIVRRRPTRSGALGRRRLERIEGRLRQVGFPLSIVRTDEDVEGFGGRLVLVLGGVVHAVDPVEIGEVGVGVPLNHSRTMRSGGVVEE